MTVAWDDQIYDRVDEAVERLQQSWRRQADAEIDPFVPPPEDSARRTVLVALIKVDQEHRWKSGQHRRVEEYLDQWPELQNESEAVKELLEAECRTRVACDSCPTRDELRARFGEIAEQVDLAAAEEEAGSRNARGSRAAEDSEAEDTSPAALPPPVVQSGYRFGRYAVLRHLGRGGMADVYLAHDPELDRQVAVKVPHPYWQASSETGDRFLQEARIAAALKHPGIVSIYDFDRQPDGTCYLVMEYIEGQPLAQMIQAREVSRDRSVELAIQIAKAAHYAHKHGLVHRDLKPANILVDREGQPHIADFGLAVHEREQRQRAGEFSGSLPYMAPEQVRGEVQWQDGRSDIWSLGVILYELLTGRRPFLAETVGQLTDEILHRDPKPPSQVDTTIPEPLERICLKCITKSPSERYSNATAVSRDLRRWQRPRWPIGSSSAAATAFGLIAVLVLAVVWVGFGPGTRQDTKRNGGPTMERTVVGPGEAKILVKIWNKDWTQRRELSLDAAGAVPLRDKDQLRIVASLDRPGYPYIISIGADGNIVPLYPWEPGNWAKRLAPEVPVTNVSIPDAADQGFPVEGPPGTDTLLLLARPEPLPENVDLEELLRGLPIGNHTDLPCALRFSNGELDLAEIQDAHGQKRVVGAKAQPIDDPRRRAIAEIQKVQREIQQRLVPYFPLTRTVCFTNQVESESP